VSPAGSCAHFFAPIFWQVAGHTGEWLTPMPRRQHPMLVALLVEVGAKAEDSARTCKVSDQVDSVLVDQATG
jgi:hypothetical protein